MKGATLKVTAIDPQSLKAFLKFASSGSQQATDALNLFAQELAQGQARNAASAGPGHGTLAIPGLGKRRDKGSKGGKSGGKDSQPAMALLAPGDPYLSQNNVPTGGTEFAADNAC